MVMNKKGFLKILEAIIAIIIVLGFVIAILPSKIKNTAGIPPDLEETTNSILKEIQTNSKFRNCVLGGSAEFIFDPIRGNSTRTSTQCIKGYIDFLSSPILTHPWNYAIRICELSDNNVIRRCEYDDARVQQNPNWTIMDNQFKNIVLPTSTAVYIKSITLSYPDVTGQPPGRGVRMGTYSGLTIYAWSKQQ